MSIVKMIFGSHLYGTDTIDSDRDYKSIILPSIKDCVLGKISKSISLTTGNNHSKNTNKDIDDETFSIQYWFKLIKKGEMIAIDMLYAPDNKIIENSKIWEKIKQHRNKLYSKNLSGYLGYIIKQTVKYGFKGSRLETIDLVLKVLNKNSHYNQLSEIWDQLPITEHSYFSFSINQDYYNVCGKSFQKSFTIQYVSSILTTFKAQYGERALLAQQNNGVDWKAVSHAFRAIYQMIELYSTGNIIFPLKNATFIRDVKLGKLDFIKDNIPSKLEELTSQLNDVIKQSAAPDNIDEKWITDFITQIYHEYGDEDGYRIITSRTM